MKKSLKNIDRLSKRIKVVGVIPARLESTRFPGKPLALIEGMPMIVHVMKRSQLSEALDEVFVATDSKEIYEEVVNYSGRAIMTSKTHKTGTDRIAEAARKIDCDIVVNIQGDEPLVRPEHISEAVRPLIQDNRLKISTLMCETDQFNAVDEVKMVVNQKSEVLYFSRADIPSPLRVAHKRLLKLYSVVAFRKDFLLEFAGWDLSPLEKIEYVEYLRALEHGVRMKAVKVSDQSQSVDTQKDLLLVQQLMKQDQLKKLYLERPKVTNKADK